MKIESVSTHYPILKQNQPYTFRSGSNGASPRGRKITASSGPVRSAIGIPPTYDRIGRQSLTTRGHFVDHIV